jgi:DNA-binding LacI/PurR family transcriptional regulator
MPLTVKIKDVAALAKVSPATVSLALNNKPGVNEATRSRILRIAKSLSEGSQLHQTFGQITNGAIRFLRIVKRGLTLNRDHDVFISAYFQGLDIEARAHGYDLEVSTIETADNEAMKSACDVSANGLILLGTELGAADISELARMGKPIVFMDTYFDYEQACFVDMDNAGDVFKAVKHLWKMGHRKIGYVRSDTAVKNFELRDVAYRRALEQLQIPCLEGNVYTVSSTHEGAYRDMLRHLKTRRKLPTAFFVINDIIAYGCIKALREKGIRVPEDVSIVGFDDLPMSVLMDPPLTTIRVRNEEVGREAMRMLVRKIREGTALPEEKIVLGGELMIRKSVRDTRSKVP